jgi:Uma2 family endonuclease
VRNTLTDPPPLMPGDHLSRDEFERRYAAMPETCRAELVEGVVHVASPARFDQHGRPQAGVTGWLYHYAVATPGVRVGTNATVRLDLDNEPQPDVLLRIDADRGGQSSLDDDGYVVGAPELVVEIAASSAAYDLHEKLRAYRRNGVREYVVWRVIEDELDWFALDRGAFARVAPNSDGILESRVCPGLWLDVAALLAFDDARVLAVAALGTRSEPHAEFVRRLTC